MTRLFRSKSYAGTPPPNAGFFQASFPNHKAQHEFGDGDGDDSFCQDYSYFHSDPIITPFISPDSRHHHQPQSTNYTVLALFFSALRKSIVTCTVDDSDDASSATSSLDIGLPTDVRHVSHVTFDRFDGFLGLPVELQPDVPLKPPSASRFLVLAKEERNGLYRCEMILAYLNMRVFGVSAELMQCSYDDRGNSVPTILLMMQRRLYAGGGLQAEGIFRINAENSQEEVVRKQLTKGFVPHGIDVHCLAGLIKAWFRELPTGVLDSLTPEQVMHCNTEEECIKLVKSLPQTEAALLAWAVNLMADVVKHEAQNKMNARNIAMVFAPNMTQMADPLTALIHAVQVMNFLKTLVIKTLRGREESFHTISSCEDDTNIEQPESLNRIGSERDEKFWSFPRKSGSVVGCEYISGKNSPVSHQSKQEDEEEVVVVEEGIFEKLSLIKGVRRLCRHPVFQLSKTGKKNPSAIVDT